MFHVNPLPSREIRGNIVLFSLKNNEKIFINVVCCIRDWRFKGLYLAKVPRTAETEIKAKAD